MIKRHLTILMLLLAPCFITKAQKPAIDAGVYGKWHTPNVQAISNDGSYAICSIPSARGYHSTIFGLQSEWQKNIGHTNGACFSPDSKWAVYKSGKDSLALLSLPDTRQQLLPNVANWCFLETRDGYKLVYLASQSHELVLLDLASGKQTRFPGITNFIVNRSGSFEGNTVNRIVVNSEDRTLSWLDILSNKLLPFWKGTMPNEFTFTSDGTSVAFVSENMTAGTAGHEIWFYKPGMTATRALWHSQVSGSDTIDVNNLAGLNTDGNKLFVQLNRRKSKPNPLSDIPGLDVYSYFDAKLQPAQFMDGQFSLTYVIHTEDAKIIQLGKQSNSIVSTYKNLPATKVLVKENEGGSPAETHWNRTAAWKVYLVSTEDGSRTLIAAGLPIVRGFDLSPDEKYVVYFDAEKQAWFSYETATGKRRNITNSVKARWTSYDRDDELDGAKYEVNGIAGWLPKEGSIMLYSQDDIFKADLSGRRSPVNLTRNATQLHSQVFRLAVPATHHALEEQTAANDGLPLQLFDRHTKNTGLCCLNLTRGPDEKKMKLQASRVSFIMKARDTNVYLVNIQRADTFPNIFMTTDFQYFKALTNVQPQRKYNWLTSELVTWKTFNGTSCQAILYKPENFDPHKRYPVIFNYYERKAEDIGLYHFPMPEANGSNIDIASFVSRGYLVAVTDIHFRPGNPGESALNAVASLATYLSRKPWVDPKRLGIDGHSYGGYMTEYIVAHSKLFAAAIAASGWSNFISASNRIRSYNGNYAQDYYEYGKQRMGGNIWDHPKNYIRASPIFSAHQVFTPLLMMNNHNDEDVDFYEGVQFYTALRRLGKTCWMLQYDGQGHSLNNKLAVADFMKREQQFFDHYLMSAPAPEWMVKGIPASQKGMTLGYELEPGDIETGKNLLTSGEQRKVNKIAHKP